MNKIIWQSLAISCLVLVCVTEARQVPNWVSAALNRFKRQDAVVDLHNSEFCVDVSTYGDVIFEPQTRSKCDSEFVKKCETKSERVCDEVTEIQCEIVPYTECQMTMEATPYKSYEMVPKTYTKKVCSEGMDTVQHTKMMPECRNVTKQNCITKWETDDEGNQVWAGNEACEPVTWRECKLVPRQVDFKVPKINCVDAEEIPYTDCEDAEKSQMTTKMVCEVKHTSSCEPVPSTKCQTIEYQECSEEAVETCKDQEIMVPSQEKEHKKKCLLPDDGINGVGPAPRQAKVLKNVEGRGEQKVQLQQLPLQQRTEEQVNVEEGTPQVLPLDRLASAASTTRQSRAFSSRLGRPAQQTRFIPSQIVDKRRIQGQFIN